jgi:hypothetical protein
LLLGKAGQIVSRRDFYPIVGMANGFHCSVTFPLPCHSWRLLK